MTLLVEHIEYLIEHNDCVVIPRVGALIKRYEPASFNSTGNLMSPRFEISFNSAIIYDDGLLACSVARRERCSYSEASSLLDSEINVMKQHLMENGAYQLGFIGTLNLDAERNLSFSPSDINFFKTLQISSGETENGQNTKAEEKVQEHNTVYLHISRFTRVASSVAAFFALALILGYCIYRPIPMGEGVMKASLLPQFHIGSEESTHCSIVQEKEPIIEDTEVESIEMSHEVANPTTTDGIPDDETINVLTEIPTDASSSTVDYKYYLIVASLASLDLANKFIAEEGDDDFIVLTDDGRFRVAAKGSITKDEVYDSRLLNRFPEAWVYIKR